MCSFRICFTCMPTCVKDMYSIVSVAWSSVSLKFELNRCCDWCLLFSWSLVALYLSVSFLFKLAAIAVWPAMMSSIGWLKHGQIMLTIMNVGQSYVVVMSTFLVQHYSFLILIICQFRYASTGFQCWIWKIKLWKMATIKEDCIVYYSV